MFMTKLITDEVFQERFAEHSVLATKYIDQVNKAYSTNVYLNDAALFVAIKSAYDDVERYKIYHQESPEIQKANAVKRVAYLTKWVMKMRPLQSPNGSDITDITPLLVNASFCLAVARAHISAELSKEFVLTLQKEYEIIYDLTFRELNGDALLSMYQNFYDIARGQNLLENLRDCAFV